jgi:HEAT repeat protein
MNQLEQLQFTTMSDAELIEQLCALGDNLPREVIDEVVERSTRVIPYLQAIVSDKNSWTRPTPEWWMVVHATYALGAMEIPETLPALLSALRWADAFECEWVAEDIPCMFGKLGEVAFAPLTAVLSDFSAGWSVRSTALSSLAATCLTAPFLKEQMLDLAARIVADTDEPVPLRQTAANVLLDFRSQMHRTVLMEFGLEEAQRKEEIANYEGAYYHWEVDDFLDSDETASDLDFYLRDWLMFYDPEERARRNDFWTEEDRHKERVVESAFDGIIDTSSYLTQCPCGSGRDYDDCCAKKVH